MNGKSTREYVGGFSAIQLHLNRKPSLQSLLYTSTVELLNKWRRLHNLVLHWIVNCHHQNKQVPQALVLSYLHYSPVVWLTAAKKDLVKLQLAQNRAARHARHCNQRADINAMHAQSLLDKRWGEADCITSSFYNKHSCVEIPNCLHSQLIPPTHTLIPPDMPTGVFS